MRVSSITKVAVLATAAVVAIAPSAVAYDLTSAGATSVSTFLEKCKTSYQADTKDTLSHAGGGSGTGKTAINAGTKDMAFSDSANTAAPAGVFHIPAAVWPIGIAYNLNNSSSKQLQLSGPTIAKIFAGTISRWNDPAIVADNNRSTTVITYKKNADGTLKKDAKGDPIVLSSRVIKSNFILPAKKIQVIYRSDSSGTTENFTNYLNKSAPSVWTKAKNKVFASSFPGNINDVANLGRIVGAASSTGVAQLAGKTPYSITYAEVNYATANKLKIANVINPAGNSVVPNSAGVGAFLASATQDANGFLTYDYATKEKGAYPLGIVSYLLADTKYPDAAKAKAVKEFANYILSTKCSKDVGGALGFSVIDGELLKKSLAQVAKIG